MIFEIKQYSNEHGMLIEERTIIKGSEGPVVKLDRFMGHAMIGVQTPMGPDTMPIQFGIDANSLEEAFMKFRDSARNYCEKMKKDSEAAAIKQSLLTPGHIPPPPSQGQGSKRKLII
jgi:hypothetical protein